MDAAAAVSAPSAASAPCGRVSARRRYFFFLTKSLVTDFGAPPFFSTAFEP